MNKLLKKSRGLKSRLIDINKFNQGILKSNIVEKFSKIIPKMIASVIKAKRDYKKEIKTPIDEIKLASKEFWQEIIEKAKALGVGIIGFASVDENLIFEKDQSTDIKFLYENAIILGMEMRYESIEKAPEPEAGLESLRIYAELGVATNELADFIRSKDYKAIACHPLGGPILYPAMAVKANLGEIGRQGLLITKKYGPRQRLSMIAINASPLPENLLEDFKISEFCEKCGKCIELCPVNAIFDKPLIKENGILTRIDGSKCFEYFYENTGCSLCIKVCPFHKIGYDKVISKL